MHPLKHSVQHLQVPQIQHLNGSEDDSVFPALPNRKLEISDCNLRNVGKLLPSDPATEIAYGCLSIINRTKF
ncbi:hypothetical protein HanXRQr2_Chr01g0022621 [Helianthus annuus]|uniref:Uncharacterized protein n=1 Tax=Helianthus annuus TaxID=4232 RepID=A0A9K3JV80_HELAN|nr:hypothetical protein HanXRQr2_Chr01g0022621 [Helianthus annuus]